MEITIQITEENGKYGWMALSHVMYCNNQGRFIRSGQAILPTDKLYLKAKSLETSATIVEVEQLHLSTCNEMVAYTVDIIIEIVGAWLRDSMTHQSETILFLEPSTDVVVQIDIPPFFADDTRQLVFRDAGRDLQDTTDIHIRDAVYITRDSEYLQIVVKNSKGEMAVAKYEVVDNKLGAKEIVTDAWDAPLNSFWEAYCS